MAAGYRDAGLGRVYLTGWDWQDGQAINPSADYLNAAMGYFMTHNH